MTRGKALATSGRPPQPSGYRRKGVFAAASSYPRRREPAHRHCLADTAPVRGDTRVSEAAEATDESEAPAPVLLIEPREGVPRVVETPGALADTIATFAGATGPVAVDAERASGYRYSQRAYLVQ